MVSDVSDVSEILARGMSLDGGSSDTCYRKMFLYARGKTAAHPECHSVLFYKEDMKYLDDPDVMKTKLIIIDKGNTPHFPSRYFCSHNSDEKYIFDVDAGYDPESEEVIDLKQLEQLEKAYGMMSVDFQKHEDL